MSLVKLGDVFPVRAWSHLNFDLFCLSSFWLLFSIEALDDQGLRTRGDYFDVFCKKGMSLWCTFELKKTLKPWFASEFKISNTESSNETTYKLKSEFPLNLLWNLSFISSSKFFIVRAKFFYFEKINCLFFKDFQSLQRFIQ